MTAPRRYGMRSLRFKLVLASVVVEALMLTVLVWNSTRITGDALAEMLQNQVETLAPMLNASLADPLAERDYATLDERLSRLVHRESLVYVEVRDELGQLASRRGEVPETAPPDASLETSDHVYDQAFDITLAGEVIGRARYGLNVSLLAATVARLRSQGVLVASAEVVLTVLLLATIGALLTRHLQSLAQAANRFAGGDYSARVPVTGRDEVADTALAFNTMAEVLARDIVELQRADKAQKQSEQRMRDLIDGLGPQMFVGLMTPDGVLLEANRPALAAAGLKPEDVLGKPFDETYWWSYSGDIQQQLRMAIARAACGEASRYDVQVRVAEKQFIVVDFSIQPVCDADGKVVLLVPSGNVITERKRAEEALHASEERLRLALEAAHMGTFDWDVPNNRITWSRWHDELWGFQPGEFDGTYEAFSARVHSEDLPGIDAEIARCVAARVPFAREFRVVWPDGSIHWIAGRGEFTIGADGQPLRMRGAVVEITEQKQAEVALRTSEEHFRTIFEQATDGILVSDVEGHFLDANSASGQMLGYSREELLKLGISDIVVPEQVERIAPEIARLRNTGVVRSEWRVRRRDGLILLVEVSAKRLPDGRLQAFLRDVTESRRAEEALRESSRQLQMLSKRVLEAQETERRRIARELHDELGQALTAIKINLQARSRFRDQSPAELDAENVRLVEEAIQQVRSLALALRPSMLDDLGLAPALRWIAEYQAERGGFVAHFGADFPDTRLAPELETACFRIAQEALTNIARHAQAKRVAIELRHKDDALFMTVQDDGRGFDVVTMRTRAVAGGSVGILGMQERAELARGKIEIESAPGQGTVVRARFPWRVVAGETA